MTGPSRESLHALVVVRHRSDLVRTLRARDDRDRINHQLARWWS